MRTPTVRYVFKEGIELCDHNNQLCIGYEELDRLICTDCGLELGIDFLTEDQNSVKVP